MKSPSLVLGLRIADALKVNPHCLALGEGASIGQRVHDQEERLASLERRVKELANRQ